MLDILYEVEQLMELKRIEFLGSAKGRLREVLERVWVDKIKWGKTLTCCKKGLYDDLKEELEDMGFYTFYEMRYGESMFCIAWK